MNNNNKKRKFNIKPKLTFKKKLEKDIKKHEKQRTFHIRKMAGALVNDYLKN